MTPTPKDVENDCQQSATAHVDPPRRRRFFGGFHVCSSSAHLSQTLLWRKWILLLHQAELNRNERFHTLTLRTQPTQPMIDRVSLHHGGCVPEESASSVQPSSVRKPSLDCCP